MPSTAFTRCLTCALAGILSDSDGGRHVDSLSRFGIIGERTGECSAAESKYELVKVKERLRKRTFALSIALLKHGTFRLYKRRGGREHGFYFEIMSLEEKLRYGAGRIDTGESRERRKWRYDLGNRAEHDLLRETAGIQDSVIKKTSTPSSGYEFCNRWNTSGRIGVRQLPDLFPSAAHRPAARSIDYFPSLCQRAKY